MTSRSNYHVIGVGQACIDLLVHVDEEFLQNIPGEKGGCIGIDLEQLNDILKKIPAPPLISAGGSCANAIKGLAGLGETCAFLSHVGSDPLGEYFIEDIKKFDITGFFTRSQKHTTQVLCLITPDGQRTMRFCEGTSHEIFDQFLHIDYFKEIKLAHFDSYNLFNGHLLENAMNLAKKANAKISLDLSSFEIVHKFKETLNRLLTQYVNILFANQDEVKALTGLEPVEGCLKLQETCSISVVLMGNQGCLVGHQGEVFHSPTLPAHVVDTTGAGDLFASGFLYGYLQDYPLTRCAQIGNCLGRAIVEIQGAELPPERLKKMKNSTTYR